MAHDDTAFEPLPGLPERPPRGEVILWQGRPRTLPLAREALWLDWVAGYFALLTVWRVAVSASGQPLAQALLHGLPFLALGAAACGLILLIAWAQARATLYTVTTARVAMRIGAALTLTLNLPFPRIGAADLALRRDGTGTVALRTAGRTKLSYLVLWPHARPWRMKRPEPALRCIPDAERVAGILARAAEARVTQPELAVAARGGAVAAE
ncbi:photosynthetic complex putative assembly protein PuhB [Tranquillimonas alkanivorans]|uniref:PH domain-containing protein n=1 Tax=Tranquillimonas alkanivorans TaxID=441119 RepID=A0A1I5LCP8_9RHOB|nr:photosynthetic complex putative assembly protein PuhB [Tranquillimonas alkanivorans]SFO94953.1 PH domain-containing protein [Tranquillimonas alkanivorans]